MNSTPDYGEPWSAFDFDQCKTRHGAIFELIAGTRNRSIACVNACAGMADPAKEIAAMREAIREVNILLRSISAHDGPGFPHGTCCNLAVQALAKLQPFIQ